MTDPIAFMLEPPPVPQSWPEERTRRYTNETPEDRIHSPRPFAHEYESQPNPWGMPAGKCALMDLRISGMSNPEIAEELGVTVKTVEVQLFLAKRYLDAPNMKIAEMLWREFKGQQ